MNSNSIIKKILIVNLHSAQNLGDLAILEQITKLLSLKHPKSHFVLMSTYPDSWKIRTGYECVSSLSRLLKAENLLGFSIPALLEVILKALILKPSTLQKTWNNKIVFFIRTLVNSDIVYSAGGGNFYTNSKFGVDFVINCLTLIIAGKLGKPIIMLPQSFGPVQTRWQQKLLKMTINNVDFVFARESLSYDFLISIGVPKNKIKILPDLALTIDNDNVKTINNESLTIGLSVIDRRAQYKKFTGQDDYEEEIVRFIKEMCKKANTNVVLIVQCDGPTKDQNDLIVSERILARLGFKDERVKLANGIQNTNEFSKTLSKLDLIISTRMHTAIIGLVNRVPTILIGYQPKAAGLFHLLDLDDYYVSINNVTSELLLEQSNKILNNYASYILKVEKCLSRISREIKKEIINLK